jgi:hypothetical protein
MLTNITVHDTTSERDWLGEKYMKSNAPWHFTIEFRQRDGMYRNAHIYTDSYVIGVREDGRPITRTVGLAPVGGAIRANPKFLQPHDRPFHQPWMSGMSTIKISSNFKVGMSQRIESVRYPDTYTPGYKALNPKKKIFARKGG